MTLCHGLVASNALLSIISKSISAYNIFKNDGNTYAFAVTLFGLLPDLIIVITEINNMMSWYEAATFWTGATADMAKLQP